MTSNSIATTIAENVRIPLPRVHFRANMLLGCRFLQEAMVMRWMPVVSVPIPVVIRFAALSVAGGRVLVAW